MDKTEYISRNAHKYNYVILIKHIMECYPDNKIRFLPVCSLKSSNTFIESCKILENKNIEIHVNDINIACFMDEISSMYPVESPEYSFFYKLFTILLNTHLKSIFLEGQANIKDFYREGDVLICSEDINKSSFGYIYNYVMNAFSEYRIHVLIRKEEIESGSSDFVLGKNTIDGYRCIGYELGKMKEFIIIEIYTENLLCDEERTYISEFIENKMAKHFSDILGEFNIIVDNIVLDADLYSVLPLQINGTTSLLERKIRLYKKSFKLGT